MTDIVGPAPSVDIMVADVIQRPIEAVASYASDPSNAPEWYAKISEAQWKTPEPVQVGSEVAFVARFLGRELRYTYRIIEHTPTLLVMATAEGPFPMETRYRFEALPDGATRMTLRSRGNPSGLMRLLAPITRRAMRRAMTKDLKSLKQHLESVQTEG